MEGSAVNKLEELLLDTEQHVEIKAPVGNVFRSVLHRFGEGNTNPKGEPMQLILEEWPEAAGFATAATEWDTSGATCK